MECAETLAHLPDGTVTTEGADLDGDDADDDVE